MALDPTQSWVRQQRVLLSGLPFAHPLPHPQRHACPMASTQTNPRAQSACQKHTGPPHKSAKPEDFKASQLVAHQERAWGEGGAGVLEEEEDRRGSVPTSKAFGHDVGPSQNGWRAVGDGRKRLGRNGPLVPNGKGGLGQSPALLAVGGLTDFSPLKKTEKRGGGGDISYHPLQPQSWRRGTRVQGPTSWSECPCCAVLLSWTSATWCGTNGWH